MAQRNMSPNKCPMPSLDPNYRNKVFEEVATGYTYEMAIEEARRCLGCKNRPCVAKCPVRIDIPEFIGKLAEEDIEGEFARIAAAYNIPVEQVKESIDPSAIAEDMKVKKALDFVKEKAVIKKARKSAPRKKAAPKTEAPAEEAPATEEAPKAE